MTIKSRCEVKKTIVLDFTLPGVQGWSSNGGVGGERQLKQDRTHDSESWSISVDQSNAMDTAIVFDNLARAIRESGI
jgi:hypothetical protein